MALANILNVEIPNNPAPFLSPLKFEITLEILSELKDDIEFKVIYVGSATNQQYDQVLESVMVGPLPVGISKFVLETPHPNPNQILRSDALGVTVILLSALYLSQEFVRVGYYVNNEYTDPTITAMYESENPPETVDYNTLIRNILVEKPKVTRFPIEWDPMTTTGTLKPGSTSFMFGHTDSVMSNNAIMIQDSHQDGSSMVPGGMMVS